MQPVLIQQADYSVGCIKLITQPIKKNQNPCDDRSVAGENHKQKKYMKLKGFIKMIIIKDVIKQIVGLTVNIRNEDITIEAIDFSHHSYDIENHNIDVTFVRANGDSHTANNTFEKERAADTDITPFDESTIFDDSKREYLMHCILSTINIDLEQLQSEDSVASEFNSLAEAF